MGSFTDGLKDFGKSVLSSGAQVLGGSVAGSVVDNILGNDPIGEAEDAVEHGANVDMRQFKQQHKFKYKFGRRKGLTPVELLGEGGGMSGSPGGAATSTLGNQAGAAEMQQNQLRMQLGTQMAMKRMETDTQRDIAEMQVGATERGQDITERIAARTFSLDYQRLQADLKQAAIQLRLSHEDLQYKMHQVATSSPEFVTRMKQLSMGRDNLLVELTMRHHGISLTNPKFESMSSKERQRIIDDLVALTSNAYIELSGIGDIGAKIFDSIKEVFEIIGIKFGKGVEPAEQAEVNNPRNPLPHLPSYPNIGRDFPGRY